MVSPGSVAFTIFGINIQWYGVLIALAILIACTLGYIRCESHGVSKDDLLDFLIISIPSAIVGARLYYVLFNWDYYAGDFFRIINIRAGGLAIHGGLIFAFIAIWLTCRYKNNHGRNISLLSGLDMVVPCIALAQSIGRWGNFFNEEAHGIETDLPWAVVIDGVSYHPTFLYESLWCLMLFFLLSYIDKRRKFDGQVTMLYGILYSFERFFVEYLRTDSLMLGPFKQAMVLSLCVFILGIIGYVLLSKKAAAAAASAAAETIENEFTEDTEEDAEEDAVEDTE